MKYPKIAVVIPCFKVEKTIVNVIRGIPDFVKYIICVNDCSPDGTAQEILALNEPRVSLISHLKNQGVGGSLLTGYSFGLTLEPDIIVKIDGDDQMDPKFLPSLIEPIINGEADYVKGNRFLHQQELKSMPFLRRAGNLGLTFLTKAASGYWNVFDPTNGYTAIASRALESLDPVRISKNYFFETSMLCELRRNDCVVKDVAIPAIYNDAISSLKLYQQLPIFSLNLLRRFFNRIVYRYFLFDFNAVSLFLLSGLILGLFGIVWGVVNWIESARTGVAATTGTVLIAVLPLILCVQLLIQAIAIDINDVPTKVKQPIAEKKQNRTLMTEHFKKLLESGILLLESVNTKKKHV